MKKIMAILITALVVLIIGCREDGVRYKNNNFDRVTLHPGESAICIQSPCAVFFMMPEGTGTYIVHGSNVFPEAYPAGQMVFLGSYWTGGYSFQAKGTETPFAFLSVVGGGGDDVGY